MRNAEIGKIVLCTNSDIRMLLKDKDYWSEYYIGLDNLSEFEKENCDEGNKNYIVVVHDAKDKSIVLFACIGNEDEINYTSLIDSLKYIRQLSIELIEQCDFPVYINTKNICSKKSVFIDDDAVQDLFRIYFTSVYDKMKFIKSEGLEINDN